MDRQSTLDSNKKPLTSSGSPPLSTKPTLLPTQISHDNPSTMDPIHLQLPTTPHKSSPSPSPSPSPPAPKQPMPTTPTLQKQLRRISLHPTLTPYRRRVYRVLLSVPPGRWTTYSALATYLGSSARAVGNAMRSNPFAPEVPCHRVLAANGSLGGYKGEWRVSKHIAGGGFQDEKRVRLEGEGVVFDADGKVMGVCFGDFRDFPSPGSLKGN